MKKNLVNFRKVLSLTVILAFASTVMINAQGGKANFEGTWALNNMKSSPYASDKGSSSLVVKQEGNSLTTTFTDEHGMSVVNKYTLDGKESINKPGGIEARSTAKFSSDGKILTIITKSIKDGKETTEQSVWRLDNSNTLAIESTISGTSGDEVTKFVYDRK